VWIHQVIVSSSCIVALAQTAAITLASEGGVSPGWRDTDPELIPQIFENTIAAADLPTAVTATIPQFTSALAGTNFSFTVSAGMPGMFHFRTSSALPFRLFFFNATAATALHYQAQWQAIRP
jgi:dUTPase